MSFNIGNVKIKNNIVLAPMAGISNYAYIKICEEMGCGYAITELISAEAIVRGNQKTFEMLKGLDEISIPVAIQIFGSNPDTLANAAKILEKEYHAKIIDINMGCPVPKVTIKNGAGSALLKNPELVRKIVSKVVSAVNIPVTVKIRSGWDEDHINAKEIAKICEEAGARAITVHGRTRKQGYTGSVNLDVIKEVVDSVSIPVIGNGDIKDIASAKKMLDYTGCTAMMIGRGLLGNPWLIKDILNDEECDVSIDELVAMMKKHITYLNKYKSEMTTVLESRTNLMYYLKGIPNTKELKLGICKCNSINELYGILDEWRKTYENTE